MSAERLHAAPADAGHASPSHDRPPRVVPTAPVPNTVVRGLGHLPWPAGNRAMAALLQRAPVDAPAGATTDVAPDADASTTTTGAPGGAGGPAGATATRPTLQRGMTDEQVGILQQKLNVAGARPQLVVDGEFGGATQSAVVAFQRAHPPLVANGTVDDATWAVLDAAVPGGDPGPGGPTPVSTGQPADPTQHAEDGVHPVLRKDATGAAVNELHEKLNRSVAAGLPTVSNLDEAMFVRFTDDTEVAVARFQRAHALAIDGVVGDRTWTALDAEAPGAGMGRVEWLGNERVRGESFLRGGFVRYDWQLEGDPANPTRLVVVVKYKFDVQSPELSWVPGALLQAIKDVWNVFAAAEQGGSGRGPVPIDFEPETADSADQTVAIKPPPGHSNASEYFIYPDEDLRQLGGHEFGHHIGLADEYQQSAAEHQRQTGTAVPVGEVTGDAPPEQIADELFAAIHSSPESERGQRTLDIIQGHSLSQGAFAQQVASRYRNRHGAEVTAAINANIPQSGDEGALSKRRLCTQPFLYNEDNLMAGAEASEAHAHDVAPRHVRHLVTLIEQATGGTWAAQAR